MLCSLGDRPAAGSRSEQLKGYDSEASVNLPDAGKLATSHRCGYATTIEYAGVDT
jgi:hypothetical protein